MHLVTKFFLFGLLALANAVPAPTKDATAPLPPAKDLETADTFLFSVGGGYGWPGYGGGYGWGGGYGYPYGGYYGGYGGYGYGYPYRWGGYLG